MNLCPWSRLENISKNMLDFLIFAVTGVVGLAILLVIYFLSGTSNSVSLVYFIDDFSNALRDFFC